MSGPYRRRLGPAKARLHGLLEESNDIIAENLANKDEASLFDFSEILEDVIGGIERQVKNIEEQNTLWTNYIQTLDEDGQEREMVHFNLSADGDNGYFLLLENAGATLLKLRRKEKETLRRIPNPQDVIAAPVPVAAPAPQVFMKLKEGQLHSFSGDCSKWPEFWDAFKSAVHEHPTLPASQKFAYLKGYLLGKAADTIAGFPITDANYNEAVELLKERFGNENSQLASLRRDWINLPVASQKFDDLETLRYSAAMIQRRLNILGDDLSTNSLAIQQLQSKIPYAVMIELEKERDIQHEWTVTTLMEGLKRYLEIRNRVKYSHPPTNSAMDSASEKRYAFSKSFAQKPSLQRFEHTSTVEKISSADGLMAKATAKYPCAFCEETHFPDDCDKYKDVFERKRKISADRKCFLCLKSEHMISHCPKKGVSNCFYCRKNHHRSLCPVKFGNTNSSSTTSTSSNAGIKFKSTASAMQASGSTNAPSTLLASGQYALLLTASVTIRRPNTANFLNCRLILDPGSHRPYLIDSAAASLDLTSKGEQELLVSTFAADQPKSMHTFLSDLEVFMKDGSSQKITVNVVSKLTDEMRRERLCEEDLFVLRSTYLKKLADVLPSEEEFFKPSILIGMDHYYDFCESSVEVKQLPSGLRLIPSRLGVLIGGRTSNIIEEQMTCLTTSNVPLPKENVFLTGHCISKKFSAESTNPLLNSNDFWSLETIGIKDSPSKVEEDSILSDFEKQIVFEKGRYYVRWPWKESKPELPKNFGLSLGRLHSLSRRLSTDGGLLQKYTDIMTEQEKKGITEEVTSLSETGKIVHYLPHHPVITPQKATTKVRVVYDASAKTNANVNSLNDCLYNGPNLIPDLCGMLLRFRLPKYVLISDVKKAFLQVGLQLADRDVTRFLWFKDPSCPWVGPNLENLATYRFCRIPFGVASSPFLLEAVIKHHLQSIGTTLSDEIQQNLYVDNILISANTTEEACEKYKEGKKIFNSMSMNLREWASNDTEFAKRLPENDKVAGDKLKILGLSWDLVTDTISVSVPNSVVPSADLTKRSLLRMVSSIYDPLGLWTPATFFGKVLFQDLWKQNFSWDASLPEHFQQQWNFAVDAVKVISETPFPRKISVTDASNYRLMVFSDASTKAYGAAIYLLTYSSKGIMSNLLFSKMRLKPIKSKIDSDTSIPRLELMGVVIGVRILNFVRQQLHLPFLNPIFWIDSQCVLCWLQSNKTLSVFVKNRVTEIRKVKDVDFRFVPSEHNPADLLTKGKTSQELASLNFWWNGPAWLKKPESEWPKFSQSSSINPIDDTVSNCLLEDSSKDQEGSVAVPSFILTLTGSPCSIECARFSSLVKLLRVTVYCLRFIKLKCPQTFKRLKLCESVESKGVVTGKELSLVENLWCSHIQTNMYAEVFAQNPGQKKNNLVRQLGLIYDSSGLIRCGGRFVNCSNECNRISKVLPILLPKNNVFTDLVVKQAHEKILHGGTNHTLTEVRKKFWITQGRVVVQRVVKQCVVCKKQTGGAFKMPYFSPLPKARIEPGPPFMYTGVDYFGPIIVKGEGSPKKNWVCLFTCLVVRAVHLELLSDMSTSEFLAGFRRFVSCRGCPTKIVSDNARQFKMADNIMKNTLKNIHSDPVVASYFSDQRIVWQFIPELSPWQGGVYERMIGVVKSSLKKALGRRLLYPHQLSTVLCEVEAVVNSRPITYVTTEFPDHPALTPANFLLPSGSENIIPSFFPRNNDDEDYLPGPDNAFQRITHLWKKQNLVLDNFWSVWSTEYLDMLKERMDFSHPHRKVVVNRDPVPGEVVIVSETGIPRGKWKLGRILKVNVSGDGKIRSASVQLPSRMILVRPITHLYPLELQAPLPDFKCATERLNLVKQERKARPTRKAAEHCKETLRRLSDQNTYFVLGPRVS